jgi:uridine phosphorylase
MQDNPDSSGRNEDDAVFTPKQYISHRLRGKTLTHPFPRFCLLGFFPGLHRYIRKNFESTVLNRFNPHYPYTLFHYKGHAFAFLSPGVGAPLSGVLLEETIALGSELFLFFGMAGAILQDMAIGEIVVPESALRDEGTSSHYAPRGPYAYPDPLLHESITGFFDKRELKYRRGSVWSTDAPYRETPRRIQDVRTKGCVAVDMEASALMTIARYRKKRLAGFLVISDSVAQTDWSPPSLAHSAHQPEDLLLLAAECGIHASESIPLPRSAR